MNGASQVFNTFLHPGARANHINTLLNDLLIDSHPLQNCFRFRLFKPLFTVQALFEQFDIKWLFLEHVELQCSSITFVHQLNAFS